MACKQSADNVTRQPDMTSDERSATAVRISLVETLFKQLPGIWKLDRNLQSTNDSEPAGECVGTATFTPREPSVFVNDEGKLELASAEMVYHEQGYFDMRQTTSTRFPFSRKYVWRLQRNTESASTFSIWFTKPGTDKIDYLFHKVSVTHHNVDHDVTGSGIVLEAEGCHLCVEDLYSSAYTFDFVIGGGASNQRVECAELRGWKMLHEVRGPQKDQVIETNFTRS